MDKIINDKYKEDLLSFLSILKQYLPKGIKHGDRSGYELEIRSCQNNPTNFKIDVFTFDGQNFSRYFDCNNNCMNRAILVISFVFNIKNVKDINNLKNICNKFIYNMIKDSPEIKNNYQFYFRHGGNNIFIDFYIFNSEIIKAFIDVGINLTEYDNFYLSFNSSFLIEKLLSIYQIKDILIEFFTLVLYVKTSRMNIDYLLECFQNVIKNHKFNNNESIKEFLGKLMEFFSLSSALKKLKLEFDAKKYVNEANKLYGTEELKDKFINQKDIYKALGEQFCQILQSKGLLYFSQAINIDNFTLFLGVPKYKNGISLTINIQGLTRFVSILIIIFFLLYWISQYYKYKFFSQC